MKVLLLTIWCLVPLGLLAYHYGPGQEGVALDATATVLKQAEAKSQSGDFAGTIDALEASLSKLPKDRMADARRIRLEIAKARMQNGELPQARTDLEALSSEIGQDPAGGLRDETLSALAGSRFYMTYLMKLEGLPDTVWEPEIEAARQEQKLLVQRATEAGDPAAAKSHADDLESSIRLARMEPEELYGKAIPKQCSGCCSGKCNNPSPVSKSGQKPKDARGAGAGAPLDGEGS